MTDQETTERRNATGLLVVSYGTSSQDVRARTIDPLEHDIVAAFPDRIAYTAWDSMPIIEKVRALHGEEHATIEEALERIAEDGITDLVVQPTFLIRGMEMQKLEERLANWKPASMTMRLGAPLLASEDDRARIARLFASECTGLGEGDMVIAMGHGSPQDGNDVYFLMNEAFNACKPDTFMVATLKEELPFEAALAWVEARKPQRVHLAPIMIAAGKHVSVDMAGPGPESWKSQLVARGYDVVVHPRGLGEHEAVRTLFIEHARNAAVFDGADTNALAAEAHSA